MRLVYSPAYHIVIGPHVFPTLKYRLVFERLVASRSIGRSCVIAPRAATWDELALVHAPEYLRKVRTGALSDQEIAQLEIPCSPEIVEGFRLMTGGTLVTAEAALEGGIAAHIGGGFHHAFAGHGEGFCLFNDVAVAIVAGQREGRVRRAAVIDCDVHQGNGTAMIFDGAPSVFTLSIHQQHNYPFYKPRSTLDIGLPDDADDASYLAALDGGLAAVFESAPDLAFYLAGADPYREDQLGGLALSREGLRERDRRVIASARAAGVPLAIVLAGGYARRVEDTVAIHAATIEEALAGGARCGRSV